MAKASGGLLLGVLREAHRRGHEAEKSRRELERAHVEQTRLTELINSAISEKRKVCHVASQAFSYMSTMEYSPSCFTAPPMFHRHVN